jgi:hypothetical protein
MATRVSPAERIRAQIDELFVSGGTSARYSRRSPAWRAACCSRPPWRRR